MEIITGKAFTTLLKANIRHKKGSFVSVVLLAFIIAMSVTTVLGIRESAFRGVSHANELCDTPDVWATYMAHMFSDAPIPIPQCDVIAAG